MLSFEKIFVKELAFYYILLIDIFSKFRKNDVLYDGKAYLSEDFMEI